MNVDFALDVHEHQSPCEADGHHHQFGPERPLQDSWGKRSRQGRVQPSKPWDKSGPLIQGSKNDPCLTNQSEVNNLHVVYFSEPKKKKQREDFWSIEHMATLNFTQCKSKFTSSSIKHLYMTDNQMGAAPF